MVVDIVKSCDKALIGPLAGLRVAPATELESAAHHEKGKTLLRIKYLHAVTLTLSGACLPTS